MKLERLTLINGELIEAIPAALAKGRGNETRRLLASNEYLLRRKADGRFIAVAIGSRFRLLLRNSKTQHQCESFLANNVFSEARSLRNVQDMLDLLGVSKQYGDEHQLALNAEPATLSFAGFDRYQRPLWMQDRAANAWLSMQRAAMSQNNCTSVMTCPPARQVLSQ